MDCPAKRSESSSASPTSAKDACTVWTATGPQWEYRWSAVLATSCSRFRRSRSPVWTSSETTRAFARRSSAASLVVDQLLLSGVKPDSTEKCRLVVPPHADHHVRRAQFSSPHQYLCGGAGWT